MSVDVDIPGDAEPLVRALEDFVKPFLTSAQGRVAKEAVGTYMRRADKGRAMSNEPNFNPQQGPGTLRVMGGRLRRSIQGGRTDRSAPETISRIEITGSGAQLTFGSEVEYAAIHERGGTINVTDQMRGFFWAKAMELDSARWRRLAIGAEQNATFHIPARPYLEPALSDALPEIQSIGEEELAKAIETRLN